MDECGSRIRRRVSVRKRNRPSLATTFATPTAAELKPSNEDEEEKAGSRRRKTVGAQPLEVQPDQLSNSPEFLIPFPAFGAMIQPKPLTVHTH